MANSKQITRVCTRCEKEFKTKDHLVCNRCRYDANKHKCLDCDKLVVYSAERCISCTAKQRRKEKPIIAAGAYGWKDGRYIKPDGYVQIAVPNYISANKNRYMAEHRFVMEQHLGRTLTKDETVHHKNGVRDDNRIDNLELWSKQQPSGQRVEDKLAHAYEIIALYGNPTVARIYYED